MEIWNALTLQPLYTFQSSGTAIRFRCGVTYSPDGHSIASCSDNAIVIWDTQTGGEVTKVECKIPSNGLKLIWSLDGEMIGAISLQESGTLTVYTYNISMGKVLLLVLSRSCFSPSFHFQDTPLTLMISRLYPYSYTPNDHLFAPFLLSPPFTRVKNKTNGPRPSFNDSLLVHAYWYCYC